MMDIDNIRADREWIHNDPPVDDLATLLRRLGVDPIADLALAAALVGEQVGAGFPITNRLHAELLDLGWIND